MTWTPPTGTLGSLVAAAFERIAPVIGSMADIREESEEQTPPHSLKQALRGDHVRVIAEVKRSSPSKGVIAAGVDAAVLARSSENGGAAAISVLTEPSRFGGSLDDLRRAAGEVRIPVLRKDFIVHPVQIWEAKLAGAAAVLLIVRALSPEALHELSATAADAGVDALFEIRDEAELDAAMDAGASIIGVNNRNLETLVIDPSTAPRLIPRIPSHIIAVAESGMRTPEDAMASVDAGADALLIGSALSASGDPRTAVEGFTSLARRAR